MLTLMHVAVTSIATVFERRLTPEGVQIFTVANFAKSTTGKIFDLARQKMIWQTKSLLAD